MRLLYHRDDPVASGSITDDRLFELYRHPLPPGSAGTMVRSNFVSSLDGSVQGPDGRSGSINTPSDQHVFALQRAHADAILVGAGTVRAEGYRGVDLADWQQQIRSDEGLRPLPALVIVTGSLNIAPDIGAPSGAVLTPGGTTPPRPRGAEVGPVVVITVVGRDEAQLDPFRDAGSTVVQQDHVRVDLGEALGWLAENGLRRVLCEGGPSLHQELLAGNHLDELCLTLAPVVVGGRGIRSTRGEAIQPVPQFDLVHSLFADDGALFTRYRRRQQTG
jgi:riboflavin biosynthesis pyrimidine reductase